MAKRRKLEPPSAEALAEIAAELSRPVVAVRPGAAPIAQIAAEVAAVRPAEDHQTQLARQRDSRDAAAWREAEGKGRVLQSLPIHAIDLDHVVRDRMASDAEEMAELKASIRASGQRLPVEVVSLSEGRFGLISGWRRIAALKELAEDAGEETPQVLALVREGREAGAIYAGMVEENELRAALTPYERGRIAAVAAGQGAFTSVDAAVDAIFAAASKSKRSKIRGFALVHEVLGDLLAYPAALGEKQGLALAQALRDGQGDRLRRALAEAGAGDARAEWKALERAMAAPQPAPAKGGRPRVLPTVQREKLPSGGVLEFGWSAEGVILKATGVSIPEGEFQRMLDRLRSAK